jgi:hypothetical protein
LNHATVNILLGNGDGSFLGPQTYAAGYAQFVALGDFNRDGHLDLAVACPWASARRGAPYSTLVNVLLGNGDGSFQAAQSYSAGDLPGSLVVGDFNGDGFPDLAVRNSDAITILLNAADWGGGHAAAPSFP